jgi:hypothetical protein
MVYSVYIKDRVITILNDNIEIIKIDTKYSTMFISYEITPNLELIIRPVYMDMNIRDIDNPQSDKLFIRDIRRDYLDIIIDIKTVIDLSMSYLSLIWAGNELKYFECFIDILVKIQKIYIDSKDIGAIRSFLCSYNNTKSARK